MNERTAKAIETRYKRLSAAFEARNGREPTIEELGELYSAEMRSIAEKSKRNTGGMGGFAGMSVNDPLKFKTASSIGGKNGKRGDRNVTSI